MIWHNLCHLGDCREILKSMVADGVRVQMCVTSPPYWGLRDYGTATWEGGDKECYHRRVSQGAGTRAGLAAAAERADGIHRNPENRTDKGGEHYIHYRDTCGLCGARRIDSQLGLEATPEEYIANMVEVFRLVHEVLADDGTLWVNMGDSYAATTKGAGGHTPTQDSNVGSRLSDRTGSVPPGLKPKDLVGMPWRLAFALQADGWYLRSDIIWAKPNPMPESVTDRPTKSHEYVFLLSKKPQYYYDAYAVREEGAGRMDRWPGPKGRLGSSPETWNSGPLSNPAGRNRRTVWTIATAPTSGVVVYGTCRIASQDCSVNDHRASLERALSCDEQSTVYDARRNLGIGDRLDLTQEGAVIAIPLNLCGPVASESVAMLHNMRIRKSDLLLGPHETYAGIPDARIGCTGLIDRCIAKFFHMIESKTGAGSSANDLPLGLSAQIGPNIVCTVTFEDIPKGCTCYYTGAVKRRIDHFAGFPPKLVEPCILAGTRPTGGVVLDPFFGSGTVGQVAESLGRSWIGIELNPNYVEMSKTRTAQIGMAFITCA